MKEVFNKNRIVKSNEFNDLSDTVEFVLFEVIFSFLSVESDFSGRVVSEFVLIMWMK